MEHVTCIFMSRITFYCSTANTHLCGCNTFLDKTISIHAFMNVCTEDKQWSPEHVQIIEVSSLVNNRIRFHPV